MDETTQCTRATEKERKGWARGAMLARGPPPSHPANPGRQHGQRSVSRRGLEGWKSRRWSSQEAGEPSAPQKHTAAFEVQPAGGSQGSLYLQAVFSWHLKSMSAKAQVTSDTPTCWSARARAKASPQSHRKAEAGANHWVFLGLRHSSGNMERKVSWLLTSTKENKLNLGSSKKPEGFANSAYSPTTAARPPSAAGGLFLLPPPPPLTLWGS